MNRKLTIFAAIVAAVTCAAQSAEAGGRHHDRAKLAAVAIGVGAASTATFFSLNNWRWNGWNSNGSGAGLTRLGAYGLTTMGCAAVSPMVATVVLDRPLTTREAHVLIGSCIVPIVGGLLVNAVWDAHPEWEPGQPVVHHRHHHKKM